MAVAPSRPRCGGDAQVGPGVMRTRFACLVAVTLVLLLPLPLRSAAAAPTAEVSPLTAPETLAYGESPLQALDFWRAKAGTGRAPLIVFVHGGGWRTGDKRGTRRSQQGPHFLATGHAFASVNYRLVPSVDVETQAQDVATALKFLLDRAPSLGIDRRRVVLMGHSAGAHLAALVGTDGRYLERAGLQLSDLAGIVLLDGAGYNVPEQLAEAGPRLRRTYREAFGSDPARQRALSPVTHATAPNARSFLILHVERADSARQSQALAAALRSAGTPVNVHGLPGRGLSGHREINVQLGDPSYPGTAIVDRWLSTLW
jgi:acetyl esterase/lipase